MASLGIVAALGLALGCGPGVSEVEADDGSSAGETTSTEAENLDGSGMEPEEMRVWPEESLGMYYFDSRVPRINESTASL